MDPRVPFDRHRQSQFMYSRTENIGKHISYFADEITAYARKVATLRDKGDNLVDVFRSYGESESYNPSLRQSLQEFAHWLAMVQDFRHVSALRLINQIVPKFTKHKDNIANLKSDIKKQQVLFEKSRQTAEAAERARAKQGEHSAVFLATFETARRLQIESSNQDRTVLNHARDFEELKLLDLQNILSDFARSELMFHCRAVEMYSAAYRALQKISTDDDLAEFEKAFGMTSGDDSDATTRVIGPGIVVPPEREPPPNSSTMRSSVSQPNLALNTTSTASRHASFSKKAAQILGDAQLTETMESRTQTVVERPLTAPRAARNNLPQWQDSDTD